MSRNPIQVALAAMYPDYTFRHGMGVDVSTGRTILSPGGSNKVIRCNGTTSHPTANDYFAVDWSAAQALGFNAGDWVLFPEGGNSNSLWGVGYIFDGHRELRDLSNNPIVGANAQRPFVIGTYDPADPLNPARYNRFAAPRFKWDNSGTTNDNGVVMGNLRAGMHDVAFLGQEYLSGDGFVGSVQMLSKADRLLFERCVFDGTMLAIQGTNVAYSGTGRQIDRADSDLNLDNTVNMCGFVDCASPATNNGGLYVSGARRTRSQRNVFAHCGWTRGATRSTAHSAGGPHYLTHSWYLDNTQDGFESICDTVWACAANLKITGGLGPRGVVDLISIRCPMTFIYGPVGNDDSPEFIGRNLWPEAGSPAPKGKFLNTTALYSDDIATPSNPDGALPRGDGPWYLECVAEDRGMVLLNGGSAQVAGGGGSNSASTNGYYTLDAAKWNTVVDLSSIISQGFGTTETPGSWISGDSAENSHLTKTYKGCITDDASLTGTGNLNRTTLAHAGIATAVGRTLAGLRLSRADLTANVTVGGTDLLTEENLMRYFARNPHIPANRLIKPYFRGPMGR